eukprot:gnl/TRDRNA2_/TRDRNA2_85674_c0_seq1.p1 gnl/TRDRNA2_/TRDRNA2_85674_c0~~gnl/TRDRNA2_/TRDRNA2_85674_c0_seq1.p1  ORF type:complete len:326 (+),score=60.15 gnl/TRDRNA2_/TRDRNA2_85674_c0_seq1:67-1044(+)
MIVALVLVAVLSVSSGFTKRDFIGDTSFDISAGYLQQLRLPPASQAAAVALAEGAQAAGSNALGQVSTAFSSNLNELEARIAEAQKQHTMLAGLGAADSSLLSPQLRPISGPSILTQQQDLQQRLQQYRRLPEDPLLQQYEPYSIFAREPLKPLEFHADGMPSQLHSAYLLPPSLSLQQHVVSRVPAPAQEAAQTQIASPAQDAAQTQIASPAQDAAQTQIASPAQGAAQAQIASPASHWDQDTDVNCGNPGQQLCSNFMRIITINYKLQLWQSILILIGLVLVLVGIIWMLAYCLSNCCYREEKDEMTTDPDELHEVWVLTPGK